MVNKTDVYQRALDLLANREHGVYELTSKLSNKFPGYSEIIKDVILELQKNNYLCDDRFASSIISHRARRGYGPVWISAYLRNKGVSREIIQEALDKSCIDWDDIIIATRRKKFGSDKVDNYKDRVKIMSFLQNRGFSKSQICSLYNLD